MRRIAVLLFFTLATAVYVRAGIKVINSEKIISDYQNNAVKADSQYKTKRIIVSGKVYAVFRDKNSRLCVEMRGKGKKQRHFPALLMYFDDQYAEEVLSLKKDQAASIETTCRGSGRINHKKIFCEESRVISGSGHSVATGGDHSVSSVITIEGDNGKGTGFVTMFHGRKVMITNTHLLFGNSGLKFLDMNNERLKVSGIRFAKDRDIAILDLVDCKVPPLVITSGIDGSFIDREIYIYGNSHGAGVNNRIPGKIAGVGPMLVEVDAEVLAPVNSGSPAIAGNRVIGVYTYELAPAGSSNKNRRFAQRIDNIREIDLQPYDQKAFIKDKNVYNRVTSTVDMLDTFLNNTWSLKQLQRKRAINKFPSLKSFTDKWNSAVTTYVRYTSNPKYKTLASVNPFEQLLTKFRSDMVKTIKRSKKYRFSYNYVYNCVGKKYKKFQTLLELFDEKCDKIIKSHNHDPLKTVRDENKPGKNNRITVR